MSSAEDFSELEQSDARLMRMTQLMLGGLLLLLLWSALFSLDVVSIAAGEVIPADRVQPVQHLEGGVIKRVLVAEGEEVRAGQALVELEDTLSGSSVAELEFRIRSYRIDAQRLRALLDDKPELLFEPSKDTQQQELQQRAVGLFNLRRSGFDNSLQVQDEEIKRRRKEYGVVTSRLASNRERLVLLEEQIQISEELMASKVTSRYEHLNLLKEANALKSAIGQDQEAILAAQAEVQQALNARDNMVAEFKQKLSSELEDTERGISEYSERIKSLRDSLDRTVLNAPAAGIVKTLYLFSKGGVVTPGATVLDLVPTDSKVIIKAQLSPQDIGYVSIGQLAQVRMNSVDSAQFGALEGAVISISPDTINDDSGMPFYQVNIETEKSYFDNGSMRYRLVPGMRVTAGIITGQRSVLRYVLSPFLKVTFFSLSER